jgi:multicomponent Na+:H+ antiporter subunit F
MTVFGIPLLELSVTLALAMSGIGLLLTFVRLALGPTLPDRVVALDLIAALAVGIIATYDILTEEPVLLDVATVVGLVTFLGTVAFAHYLVRRGRDE